MLRQLTGAAVFLVLLTAMARAQLPPPPFQQRKQAPPENALQEAESERQHRAALKTIQNKKPVNDPWRNMRSVAKDPSFDRHRPE